MQCALRSGAVGGAVGEDRGEGGWAELCPTGGGTDEVREKWREMKRV